jgi:stage II sporulation protein D
MVLINPRGKLTVANRVSLQSYLRGVLPHEIGRLEAATLEAGKAQAVAARTYTLSYVGRRAAEGFDLYDSVEDQVYGGSVDESTVTNQAVGETDGIVLLHSGFYIRANYHSTCGGATVNVEDVWPDPAFPWLRQVEDGSIGDPWCKSSRHFRWTEHWTGAQALSNLNRYGPEQSGIASPRGGWKELRDVRVASRTPCGRVRELVFRTERGDIVVFADRTRWVMRRPAAAGGGILRSSLFKVAVRKDRRGRVSEVLVSGGGNGHGAGMCQVGALAQARAGRAYADILRSYYTGVDLVRL